MAQQGMKTTSEFYRSMKELTFFRNTKEWPHWPVLPMKMREGDLNDPKLLGIVHASNQTRVYFANMIGLSTSLVEARPRTWFAALEGVDFQDYPSDVDLLIEYMID